MKRKMFGKLLKHNIISNDGQFFCHICMCTESSIEDALYHINKDTHRKLKSKQTDKLLRNYTIETYQELNGNNNVAIIVLYNFICLPCRRKFIDLIAILQHVRGECHVKELKNVKANLDYDQIKYVISNASGKGKLHGTRKLDTAELELLLKNDYTYVNNNCVPIKVFPSQTFTNKICKQLIENKIITNEYCQLMCETCKRCYQTPASILEHMRAENHTFRSEQPSAKSDAKENGKVELCLTKTMYEQEGKIVESLTDQSYITAKNLCSSHSKDGRNANGKMDNLNNDCSNTDQNGEILTMNAHQADEFLERVYNETTRKGKNGIAFPCSSYFCELCKQQIDVNNLFEHVNTVKHRCNIFSTNMGDDIILFKCFCCRSIIQGNSLLIDHLSSNSHKSNLTNYIVYPEANKIEGYLYTCNNVRNNVLNNVKDKSLSLCNIFTPHDESAYTRFNEQCLIFFDMPDIKCYSNITNNILYYCSLCTVKLNTDHNLIEHCQAKTHLWKVKQLFLKKHQYNTDKIPVLTDRVNKVSISHNKSQKPDDFSNEFVLTSDVNADIEKLLQASPVSREWPKHGRKKEESLIKRLNMKYDKKYLDIEEEMYNICEERLTNIEANLSLIMPYKKKFYCMVCDEKVSEDVYLLYEHVCLDFHKTNEIECIRKDVSSVKLFRQYIKEISKDSVKCYTCETRIQNNVDSINIHIKNEWHRKRHKTFVRIMTGVFNSMSQALKSLWYSIQRFSCTLCNTNFNYKLEFVKHIIAKHNQSFNARLFEFCIPCATLWLSKGNSYAQHCNDIVHKYLVRSKDFMVEEHPECMKEILTQVDEFSDILFKKTEILSNDRILQEVKGSLESILKSYFPSVEAFLFGSRVTGLGFASSDIDIYLDYGGTYCEGKGKDLRRKHLISTETVLLKHKDVWEVRAIIDNTRTPIIKLVYKRTGVHCDISVTNGLAVENSKLIRSYNDAYLPCRKLILFIKKWLSYCNLPTNHGLTNYALAWFVIFYLQTESHLPSVASLIKEENNSRRICGWEVGVAVPKNNNKSVQPIFTLLLGFFKFYASFDYRYHVICPLIGQPLSKLAFSKIDTLPEEMGPYIEHLNTSNNPEYFRIDSTLCVQDPFDLSHNLTKAVSSITLKHLKQYCADSASILLSLKK